MDGGKTQASSPFAELSGISRRECLAIVLTYPHSLPSLLQPPKTTIRPPEFSVPCLTLRLSSPPCYPSACCADSRCYFVLGLNQILCLAIRLPVGSVNSFRIRRSEKRWGKGGKRLTSRGAVRQAATAGLAYTPAHDILPGFQMRRMACHTTSTITAPTTATRRLYRFNPVTPMCPN